MSCTGKLKLTCQGNQYATCINYEGELPEWSELDECVDIKETTQELYKTISDIKDEIDLSEITSDCITLPTTKTVKTIMQAMIDFICTQSASLEALQNIVDNQAQQIEDLQQQNCP